MALIVVGLRLSHPLLQPPVTDQPVTGTVTTRGHRSGRQRRYQYIQFNPRHPHPPAILQRLLGPSTAQEVIQLTTGQALNQGMRDARFLVMDATAVSKLMNQLVLFLLNIRIFRHVLIYNHGVKLGSRY